MRAFRRPLFLPALAAWFSLALVLVAVIFLPLGTASFVLPKVFFLALAALLGALAALRDPERDALAILLTTWTGRAFLALIFVTAFSPLWSIAPLQSIVGASPRFLGVLVQLSSFAIALAGIVLVQREGGRRWLLRSLLLANVLVTLYGFLQLIGLDPFAVLWQQGERFLGRVFSTIGQPTMLGNFLILTLPFIILESRKKSAGWRWFWMILILLNLAVLLGTASRGALLGLA
ncbi:MAG: hypothetical protein V1876_00830, partial [Candidatus Peregrinibacteria bacterium]